MTTLNDFDWEFYLLYNHDVEQYYGCDKENLLLHYKKYGIFENRIYSEKMLFEHYPHMKNFDTLFYKSENVDLINLTHFELINHYICTGSFEKRKILFNSDLFNFTKNMTRENNIKLNLKVSIIVVIQKENDILSLQNVINQLYENLEIVIVDDNSDCENQILKITENDKRIIKLKNISTCGYILSVKFAHNVCNGDYIMCNDCSIIMLLNCIENIVSCINTNDIMLIKTNILKIDLPNDLIRKYTSVLEIFPHIARSNIVHKVEQSTNMLMYKKTFFNKINHDFEKNNKLNKLNKLNLNEFLISHGTVLNCIDQSDLTCFY